MLTEIHSPLKRRLVVRIDGESADLWDADDSSVRLHGRVTGASLLRERWVLPSSIVGRIR